MKGFIEVTTHKINKYYINIKHIVSFGENWVFLSGNEYPNNIDETYEEIKQLIKNSK